LTKAAPLDLPIDTSKNKSARRKPLAAAFGFSEHPRILIRSLTSSGGAHWQRPGPAAPTNQRATHGPRSFCASQNRVLADRRGPAAPPIQERQDARGRNQCEDSPQAWAKFGWTVPAVGGRTTGGAESPGTVRVLAASDAGAEPETCRCPARHLDEAERRAYRIATTNSVTENWANGRGRAARQRSLGF